MTSADEEVAAINAAAERMAKRLRLTFQADARKIEQYRVYVSERPHSA